MEQYGQWKRKFLYVSSGNEKKWNGVGIKSRIEKFHKCYREWEVERNGM